MVQSGCKTVFDIAPAYFSPKSGAELGKALLQTGSFYKINRQYIVFSIKWKLREIYRFPFYLLEGKGGIMQSLHYSSMLAGHLAFQKIWDINFCLSYARLIYKKQE